MWVSPFSFLDNNHWRVLSAFIQDGKLRPRTSQQLIGTVRGSHSSITGFTKSLIVREFLQQQESHEPFTDQSNLVVTLKGALVLKTGKKLLKDLDKLNSTYP